MLKNFLYLPGLKTNNNLEKFTWIRASQMSTIGGRATMLSCPVPYGLSRTTIGPLFSICICTRLTVQKTKIELLKNMDK